MTLDVRELAAASRTAQGLPLYVADAAVLAKVAALLRAADDQSGKPARANEPWFGARGPGVKPSAPGPEGPCAPGPRPIDTRRSRVDPTS